MFSATKQLGDIFAQGKPYALYEGRFLSLKESPKDFGVILVTAGTVSLNVYDDTPTNPGSLVKNFKQGEVIFVDLILAGSLTRNLAISPAVYDARIAYMSYNEFSKRFYKGNEILQGVIESTVDCIPEMLNKQVLKRNTSSEKKYALVIQKAMHEQNICMESDADECGYAAVSIFRNDIASVTGLAPRTIKRAHSNLIQMKVLRETKSKGKVLANLELVSQLLNDSTGSM